MTQYQHYIPQFLLRNFSHPFQPQNGEKTKEKDHCRIGKGQYAGTTVLNIVDLALEEPQLTEAPVSRWFGQDEMYRDVSDTIKAKKDVEKALSKLESRAADIINETKRSYEKGDTEICLTRVKRNTLRKFLFLMKYRGPGFFEKYYPKDPEAYNSEDKNLLRDYMTEKGFTTPRQVWLHNLRAILDINMDAKGMWMERLGDLMFPADAALFIFHAQHSYMAFCTPEEKDDEFILTDHAYNLFEGPTHNTFCTNTGQYVGDTHLCFHEFGPVSPRLIIVLRSGILPEPLEDRDSKVKKARQRMLYAASAQFPDPENVRSILEDLPVAKAMNSYLRIVNDSLELAPGESGTPQSGDIFTFRFWPISTKHVNIINSIFLDNLLRCNSIVFGSKIPFRRTLEAYMTSQEYGFKKIGVGEYGAKSSRLACLEKLAIVLKKLGVENVPIACDKIEQGNPPLVRFLDDEWLEVFKRLFEGAEEPSNSIEVPFWQVYRLLGGTSQIFLKDLDQSWRLYKFQSCIVKWTAALETGLRENAIACGLDIILKHHPRRVWLYVKHLRWMRSEEYAMHQQKYIGTGPIYAAKTAALFKQEIEDSVVKGERASYLATCRMTWH